jgi:cytosolic iron-sulfur protein assembly protein CIAO1
MEWKQASTFTGSHERTIFSVDWSVRDDLIVTGAADDTIRIFQLQQSNNSHHPSVDRILQYAKAHSNDVNCVRWCPVFQADGTLLLASAGDDALIRIWQFTA